MADQVRVDIVADDQASDELDKVAKLAAKVDKTDPTVDIKANTKQADHTVDGFAHQLDKLTDADKVVVLSLRAAAATAELRDLTDDLATIDAADPDIAIKFDRFAEVSGQLEHIETQMKDIAATSIDPDVSGKAAARLKGVGDEANKAGGAVHSMAGNAIGDFAATATGVGPLGEALGQLSETALEAEGSIGQIAGAAAGMGGLAAAMYVVQRAMSQIAAAKAFDRDEVEAFTKSLRAGDSAATALRNRLEETGKVMGTSWATNASDWIGLSDSVRDYTKQVTDAGLTLDQYSDLVTGGADGIKEWARAQLDAGANGKQVLDIVKLMSDEQDNLKEAQDRAATSAKFFADRQHDAGRAVDKTTRYMQTQQEQLDALKRDVSDGQAWVDLQQSFDDVRTSAKDAWDAAKTGADDADTKVRAHQTSLNNLRLTLIDYGTRVLGLPKEVVSNLVMHTNDEELDDTQRKLNELKAQREIRIKFVVDSPSGWYLLGSRTTATQGMAPTSVVNVTQVLPAGYHGDALADAEARSRRSGGLYQRRRR